MDLAQQANNKEEFIEKFNIRSQEDLNKYLKNVKTINLNLFVEKEEGA